MRADGEVTLRFLAAPTDLGYSGNVDGGRVLEWIDKAAYALAVQWSGRYAVTAYVGNVHFRNPVKVGALVEVHVRLIHTGRSSMHMQVAVESLDPRNGARTAATDCLIIFVAVDDEGRPVEVPVWEAHSADEKADQASAVRRVKLRADIEAAMAAQRYTDASTAPSVTLRFLSAPADLNWGGKVHGGNVMRWIDEAAHVLATNWTGSSRNVAIYTGGIRFYRPLHVGEVVEVEARLVHTGNRSMHMSIHVRSADPRSMDFHVTTHCLVVFVALDEDGRAIPCPAWEPQTDEDRSLDRHAVELIELRAAVDREHVSNPKRIRL